MSCGEILGRVSSSDMIHFSTLYPSLVYECTCMLIAGTYQVVNTGQPVAMHPSSVLFGKQPSCVVFNEIVWTTKQYMVAVAAVDQQWLREAGSQYFR